MTPDTFVDWPEDGILPLRASSGTVTGLDLATVPGALPPAMKGLREERLL